VQVAKLEAERSALSRLDRIKADQGARATALEKEAGASELRANLIEYNLDAVDAALDAVNAGGASSVAVVYSSVSVLCGDVCCSTTWTRWTQRWMQLMQVSSPPRQQCSSVCQVPPGRM
jgi:hypothetical protein